MCIFHGIYCIGPNVGVVQRTIAICSIHSYLDWYGGDPGDDQLKNILTNEYFWIT